MILTSWWNVSSRDPESQSSEEAARGQKGMGMSEGGWSCFYQHHEVTLAVLSGILILHGFYLPRVIAFGGSFIISYGLLQHHSTTDAYEVTIL